MENPDLIGAMAGVATGDGPEARRRLYAALLGSTLLVLVTPEKGENRLAGPGRPFKAYAVLAGDGRRLLPVFTDEPTLRAWPPPPGLGYMAMEGPALFSMALKGGLGGLIINPGGPTGGEVTHQELSILGQGSIPDFQSRDLAATAPGARPPVRFGIPRGAGASIGRPPRELPGRLVSLVRAELSRSRVVAEAYLFLMVIGGGTPNLTLGVVPASALGEEAVEDVARTVLAAAHPALTEHDSLDFIVLNPDLRKTVRQQGKQVWP